MSTKETPLKIKTMHDPRGQEYGLIHHVMTIHGRIVATCFSLVDAELIVSLVNSVIYPDGSIIKAWERTCPRIQQ